MSKSKLFFILCLSFIIGIAAHSLILPDKRIFEPFIWYAGFLGGTLLSVIILSPDAKVGVKDPVPEGTGFLHFDKRRVGRTILFFALVFLGLFRYSQVIPVANENHILYYVGKEVTVRGVVDAFPRRREATAAYVVKVQSVILSPDVYDRGEGPRAFSDGILPRSARQNDTEVNGKLLLTAELFPPYDFGDELTFVCAPDPLGKYEQYARREGVSAACAFPRHIANTAVIPSEARDPARVGMGFFTTFRMTLFNIRQTFHLRLAALFPNPYGGLLAGLLYGDTSGFSSELKETFRITGISHITALSGYNVTVLSQVLIAALIALWLTRKQALPVALLLIFGFVVATGAEASVVRAAIMGFLILGAKGIGRLSKMRIALSFAGAVMLAVNPMLLRFDLGFQLSFLATIALIWFADDIARRTWMRYLPRPFGIREAGSASAAAILFTAPLLFYTTGMLGPLSLLVNILVVPVVPLAMAAGFAAVAADFIFHPLGVAASWLARVPLEYIIGVAEYFARFGAVHLQMNAAVAVLTFLAIVAGIWRWKKKYKKIPNSPNF